MKYYRTRHYEVISDRYVAMKGYVILELDSRIPDDMVSQMSLRQRVLNSVEVVKYPTFLYIPPMWDLRKFVSLHQKYGADWQVLIELGIDTYCYSVLGVELAVDEINEFISKHPRFVDALRFTIESNNPDRIKRLAKFARKDVTTIAKRVVWKNDSTLKLKNHLKFILSVAEGGVK